MAKFETKGANLYIDGKQVIKAFESWNSWFWFATEIAGQQDSVIDGNVYPNDTIYFGFVQGFEEEWGYFSKAELESLKPKVWEIRKWDLAFSGRRK